MTGGAQTTAGGSFLVKMGLVQGLGPYEASQTLCV